MLLQMVLIVATASQAAVPSAIAGRDGSLAACRTIVDRDARLNCYDRATVRPEAQPGGGADVGGPVPVQPPATHSTRPPRAAKTGPIETHIVTANRRANGRWTLRLADGSVWVQTDDRGLNSDPQPGQSIRIRPATMGTFFANVNRQVAIRIRPVG